jgi:hypothetical protein
MGILDDAIREHLDLKRRRGADPSEIDRLEREALGPVRRAPREATDLMDEDQRPPAGAYRFDEENPPAGSYPSDEELHRWADSPAEFEPYGATSESSLVEPASPPGLDEWPERELVQSPRTESESEPDRGPRARHHEIAEEWEAHERRELAGEPAGLEPDMPAPAPAPPSPPASADRPAPSFEEETAEYRLEGDEAVVEPEGDEPRDGEDMLEETPDFLQDTPDHDRLWFEQRPPRDFDFDG